MRRINAEDAESRRGKIRCIVILFLSLSLGAMPSGCAVNHSTLNSDMSDKRIESIVRRRLDRQPDLQSKLQEAARLSPGYQWHGLRCTPWNAEESELRVAIREQMAVMFPSPHEYELIIRVGDGYAVESVERKYGRGLLTAAREYCPERTVWAEHDPWIERSPDGRRVNKRVVLDATGKGRFTLEQNERYINLSVYVPGHDSAQEPPTLDSSLQHVEVGRSVQQYRPKLSGAALLPNELGYEWVPDIETLWCISLVVEPHYGAAIDISMSPEACRGEFGPWLGGGHPSALCLSVPSVVSSEGPTP